MRTQSDVIELITYEKAAKNENGIPIQLKKKREVFAEIRSVGRSEYWKAQQQGVVLSATFLVRAVDYCGERIVRYNNQIYRVQRAPCPDGEWCELNCSSEGV